MNQVRLWPSNVDTDSGCLETISSFALIMVPGIRGIKPYVNVRLLLSFEQHTYAQDLHGGVILGHK